MVYRLIVLIWAALAGVTRAETTATIIPLQPRIGGPCATVYGYLPYWEKTATLRYELLTHVACFSVGARADGTVSNTVGWPWASVINAAHQQGVKVILVATQFDPDLTLQLVTNPTAKNNFFANIATVMQAGKADGLNIDFEGAGEFRNHINGFMADLTAYLHAQIPGSEVTFAGPAVNWGNTWNLAGLAESCDGIFIMGYDFYGSWSSTSGPSSPLTGGNYNLNNTVYTQYRTVQNSHPEKLILGIPYYGNHWKTQTDQPRSTAIEHVSSIEYADAHVQAQIRGLLWDATSQTHWYRYHDGTNWHQVWFDNADSIRLKYQLAKDANLQGVGMWALGYDQSRQELWDLLRDEFILACRPPLDATLVDFSCPATMMVGTTATAWIEFRNTGGTSWSQDTVRLGTWNPQDRASPFYTAGDWLNVNRPSDMDSASCDPDEVIRFTFTLTAPAQPAAYDESWRLLKENVAWFGVDSVRFQIAVVPRPIPGDFDQDRDVDMDDFAFLQNCMSGTGVPFSPGCQAADLDADGDVDAPDASLLKGCMSGTGIEGNPDCPAAG